MPHLRVFFFDTAASGTPAEICQELHRTSFLKEADEAAYRRAVADRVYILSGHPVRHAAPETFLEDLVALGYAAIDPDPS